MLCRAALSVQGLSVLMQVRTICPPEMTLRPLYRARLLHLPLSLLVVLSSPSSAGAGDVQHPVRPRDHDAPPPARLCADGVSRLLLCGL
ncbi:MAG: hypothetical protein ACLVES_00240 [Faecalibacterium prausnitzii]